MARRFARRCDSSEARFSTQRSAATVCRGLRMCPAGSKFDRPDLLSVAPARRRSPARPSQTRSLCGHGRRMRDADPLARVTGEGSDRASSRSKGREDAGSPGQHPRVRPRVSYPKVRGEVPSHRLPSVQSPECAWQPPSAGAVAWPVASPQITAFRCNRLDGRSVGDQTPLPAVHPPEAERSAVCNSPASPPATRRGVRAGNPDAMRRGGCCGTSWAAGPGRGRRRLRDDGPAWRSFSRSLACYMSPRAEARRSLSRGRGAKIARRGSDPGSAMPGVARPAGGRRRSPPRIGRRRANAMP